MNDDPREDADSRALADAWREASAQDANESPPPAVDAAILAAARAAVRPRRPRYALPLALAASLVVAVGLGLRQQREVPPPASPAAPSVPVAAEQTAPATSSDDVGEAADAAAASPARPRVEGEQKAAEPAAGRAEALTPSTAGAPAEAAPSYRFASPAAPVARDKAADDVVADIRALLAAGNRAAATTLARDYVGRSPPGVLPPDLEFLLTP
jgi:hypothetical protein